MAKKEEIEQVADDWGDRSLLIKEQVSALNLAIQLISEAMNEANVKKLSNDLMTLNYLQEDLIKQL